MVLLAAVCGGATPRLWERLQQWLVSCWLRCGGCAIWPPRRQTASLYFGVWAAVSAALYFGFVRVGRSLESEWEQRRKRTVAEASIKNLLEYEQRRRQAEDAAADSSSKREAGLLDTDNKQEQAAPDVEKMLSLLYDEVEAGAITKLGVDKREDWFRSAVALLRERLEVELQQTIDMTRVATGLVSLENAREPGSGMTWSSSPEAVEELEQYKDGEKLQALVNTIHSKVCPAFGRQLISTVLVMEAKQLAAKVATRREAAVRRIWLIFRPLAKRWCLGTVILMVTEGMWGVLYGHLMSLCNLGFNLQPDTMEEAGRYAAKIAAGFLLVFPFDNLGDTLVDAVEAKMQLGLRSTVMASLLRQDREFFDHHQSGVLQERLNKDTEDLARTIIQQPKNLLSALTRIITKSVYLYYLSPGLFWVGVCIPVPICCIVETLGFKKLRSADTKIGKVNDQAAASTSDLLREISTVRQFGMEETELTNFKTIATWREQLETAMKTVKIYTEEIMSTTYAFTDITVMYTGLSFVVAGTLDPGRLMLAAYQFDGIIWGSRQIIDLIPEIARTMQPLTRVATLLDTVPTIEPHPEHPASELRPTRFEGKIEFQSVDFTYPSERQKQVLRQLSFVAEPRTKVALVGKAGCGKSTTVLLLQRFYNPSSGSILLDGRPIQDFDVQHLRRHIGVVSQDNILFSNSIYNNITYGMGHGHLPVPTEAEVWAACNAANVTEFLDTFPSGIHTFIGERGVKLSGGQKQRLAIARAIIRKPTILLLDEATSALDSVNEKEVQKALDAMLLKHRGVAIVIAHRLTTIKNCDKICVIDQGTKVEEGTHDELMAIDIETRDEDGRGHSCGETSEASSSAAAAEEGDAGCTDAKRAPTRTVTKKGFYHKMWDTQMGEETFADVGAMSNEQLRDKLRVLRGEIQRLQSEALKRGEGSLGVD